MGLVYQAGYKQIHSEIICMSIYTRNAVFVNIQLVRKSVFTCVPEFVYIYIYED